MCLRSKNPTKISDKSITCYKVAYKIHNNSGVFYSSPYRGDKVGTVLPIQINAGIGDPEVVYSTVNPDKVKLYRYKEGFIHAFIDFEKANEELNYWSKLFSRVDPSIINNERELVLLKCTIPEGVEYAEGSSWIDCHNEFMICSRSMIINQELITISKLNADN